MSDTTIERVEVWRLYGRMPVERDLDAPAEPAGLYGEWRPQGLTLGTRLEKSELPVEICYLKLIAEDGHEGLCLGGVYMNTGLLQGIVRDSVIGRDAMDHEHIWHDIHRTPRFSARGEFNVALGWLDVALWDLRGKCMGLPVSALMGGTRRTSLPAYGMTLALPGAEGPDMGRVRAWAQRLRQNGYRYLKWCIPALDDDDDGAFRRRVEMVRVIDEALGDDVDYILCAPRLGKKLKAFFEAVAPYGPMHIQVNYTLGGHRDLADIRRMHTVPVGTGQGVQSRWELAPLLEGGCLDVLGADPFVAGGLTELRKMAHLAEAYGVQLYPHCDLPENMPVAASLPASLCPMVECLIAWIPHRLFFEAHDFVPKRGCIAMPTHPGIYRWAEDRIEKKERIAEWRA